MKNIVFFLITVPMYSFASIEVAFIEMRNSKNKVVQLEPGGQFAHLAISYQGKWLHSYPPNGVEVISQQELERIGTIKKIVIVSETDSVSVGTAENFLGKPYDASYSWSDDRVYCAELVAKILKIEPQPMEFKSSFWPKQFKILKGNLGLSPDDIFKALITKGYPSYNIKSKCEKLFH